jgi:putative ABC transport system permease protein
VAGGQDAAESQPAAERNDSAREPDILLTSRRLTSANDAAAVQRYGLTHRDLDRIVKVVPGIATATPLRIVPEEARHGDRTMRANLVGCTADLVGEEALSMARGRFLTGKDTNNRNNVAVLDSDSARRLFANVNPVGSSVRVKGHYFLVVGVLRKPERFRDARREPPTPKIYIPLTTMRTRFGDRVVNRSSGKFDLLEYELSEVRITLKKEHRVDVVARTITALLKDAHETQDYSIKTRAR